MNQETPLFFLRKQLILIPSFRGSIWSGARGSHCSGERGQFTLVLGGQFDWIFHNSQIKLIGIIEVLRKGITDNNIKLKLFFDKPVSTLNEKDIALYNQNIFSVTRQVHYSTQNENSLDMVVFINGLPIITFELKNELTKQNVKDAIKQYKTSRDSKEELFRLGRCIVHFAVDTEQVWMATHLKKIITFREQQT